MKMNLFHSLFLGQRDFRNLREERQKKKFRQKLFCQNWIQSFKRQRLNTAKKKLQIVSYHIAYYIISAKMFLLLKLWKIILL